MSKTLIHLCVILFPLCSYPQSTTSTYSNFIGLWDGAGLNIDKDGIMGKLHIISVDNNILKGQIFTITHDGYRCSFTFESPIIENKVTVNARDFKALPYQQVCGYAVLDRDYCANFTIKTGQNKPQIEFDLTECSAPNDSKKIFKLYFQKSEIDTNYLNSIYKKTDQHQWQLLYPKPTDSIQSQKWFDKFNEARNLLMREKFLANKTQLQYFPQDSLLIASLQNIQPFPIRLFPEEYEKIKKSGEIKFRNTYFSANEYLYGFTEVDGIWLVSGEIIDLISGTTLYFPNKEIFEKNYALMKEFTPALIRDTRNEMYKSSYGVSSIQGRDENISKIQTPSKEQPMRGLSPGSIHPQAKILEADELFPFYDGVARIHRGTGWALIDAKGNFVLPYNKWIIHSDSRQNLLAVQSPVSGRTGVINSSGKLIFMSNEKEAFTEIRDEYIVIQGAEYSNSNHFSLIDQTGNRIKITLDDYLGSKLFRFSEGLGVSYIQMIVNGIGHTKVGYKNRKGELVIPAKFDEANNFKEGMALVGVRNEFQEMKYGFINKTGKVIVPIQYSIKPTDFSCGLALVQPVKKDEFRYAYINKRGEIKIKLNKAPNGEYFVPSIYGIIEEFHNGVVQWNTNNPFQDFIIDTSGNITSLKDYLKGWGIEYDSLYFFQGTKGVKDNKIIIQSKSKWYVNGSSILNIKTKTALPFIFNIPADFPLDSVSKLTLTSHVAEVINDKKKMDIVGYINEQGVYVIIKGPGSEW